MADWAKIALKLSLVLVLTAGIFALLAVIPFPAFSLTQDMINGIAFAKGVLNYWIPNFNAVFGLIMGALVFYVGSMLWIFGVQAYRWLWTVNE